MKNFYDSWQVILDDRGKPLVGKILFCEANTTDIVLKTVYTVDGQELDNPIYCNVVPSTQVMLGDGDYTVRFYRYIGHGNMESDENEDSWLLYKTELIKDGVVSGSSSGTIGLVDDVLHLKNWKGMEDGDVMEVLGYYTTEDCPARYFVWHANGNYRDDGGVIITSNTTTKGAWVMKIPGTYIDVRWYGDIPSRSASGVTSNMGQRTNAANAANKYNKDLYFPAYTSGTDNGFYLFDGSNTVSVAKDIICDDGVRFVVKEGTVGTSIICHELQKCEKYLFISSSASTPIGEYSIIANWVNTSWISKDGVGGNARVGYVIDYLNTPMTFKDTKIKFERDGLNVSNCVFNNCEFVDCNRNIDKSVTMYNMDIDYKWFANDYNFANLTIYDCKITLHNCKDADQYIMLKNKQNDYNYGDLGEQNLNNPTVYAGGTIENCYGTVTVTGTGMFELHNASLTLNGLNENHNLNLVDCWITLPTNSVVKSIALRRGSINGAGSLQVVESSLFEDVEIDTLLFAQGSIYNHLIRCKINRDVAAINLKLHDCDVNAHINNACVGQELVMDIVGNKFNENGFYVPIATIENSIAKGVILNNVGVRTDMHWIKLDRTNWSWKEVDHSYIYEGNVEPYIEKINSTTYSMLVRHISIADQSTNPIMWVMDNAGGDPQWCGFYGARSLILAKFTFGLAWSCELHVNYHQSLIYKSDSYRHPYYTFLLYGSSYSGGPIAPKNDRTTSTSSDYIYCLNGISHTTGSWQDWERLDLGCNIYGAGYDVYDYALTNPSMQCYITLDCVKRLKYGQTHVKWTP